MEKLLAAAYHETGARKTGMLAAFRAIRDQRRKLVGEYLEQELLVEHLEGCAEYAGCRALQSISPDKFRERIESYLSVLKTMDKTFFDIRRQAYFNGAVYNLACADCGDEEPFQTELRHCQQVREERIKGFLKKNPVKSTHFVVLRFGEDTRFLDGPVLLKPKQRAGREVEEYWVLPQ